MEAYGRLAWRVLLPDDTCFQTFCHLCFTAHVALRVRRAVGDKQEYWTLGLVHTILGTYGGGTIAALLLGQANPLLVNQWTLPFAILTWFLLNSRLTPWIRDILLRRDVEAVLTGIGMVHRSRSIVGSVASANNLVGRGEGNMFNLGPMVVGGMSACGGAFYPLTKGFSPIADGTPTPVQNAFVAAAFAHFTAFDKSWFGGIARMVLGTWTLEYAQLVVTLFTITANVLPICFDTDINLMLPVNKTAYLLLQVPGGSTKHPANRDEEMKRRVAFERLFEVLRIAAVFVGILAFQYMYVPESTFHSGHLATPGVVVGSCQFLPALRECTPHMLYLHENGTLAVYAKPYQTLSADAEAEGVDWSSVGAPVWMAEPRDHGQKTEDLGIPHLELDSDGALRVWAEKPSTRAQVLFWSSKSHTGVHPRNVHMTISDKDGAPQISDGLLEPWLASPVSEAA